MAVDNFIPELWSNRIMARLQKSLVFAACCNRDYEGEISAQGDTVRINAIGPVTVALYTKNSTSVSPEVLMDESQVLKIDKCNYFAFKVDDVDKAQATGGILGAGMEDAAYRLRDAADQVVAALYASAGGTISTTAYNSLNALAGLLTLGQTLDEYNVPTEGRWVIIPPWFKTKLILAKVLVENQTNQAFDNGFVGRCAGFDVRESNNVYNDATTWQILAGTNKAITFAQQVNKVEAYRPEASFSDAVKGLHLFGAKVVYPEALARMIATVAAEA
jgi:hypothetical protein